MVDDVLKELADRIAKAQEALRRELGRLRTGRASPSILDGLRADYYSQSTPLNQLGTLSTPEARLILIKVWDRAAVKAVESAIRASDLGLNPQVDGDLIRIPIPQLTEERRRELTKVARRQGEEARVAVRNARRDAKEFLDQLEKEGQISGDDSEAAQKKVQAATDDGVKRVDEIVAHKEKDIMEV